MKCLILLHSATGNTRLMTRYAAARIRAEGHTCTVHDIAAKPRPPALGKVDLVGFACPTMYFRPTFAMERFVARIPAPASPKPAFLLGTAGGEPGSHFALLAEQLAHKNLLALGAHWVMFPESWPPHRRLVDGLGRSAAVGARLCGRFPSMRAWVSIAWPDLGVPVERDRDALDRFLRRMLAAAPGFSPAEVPFPAALHKPMPGFSSIGRMVTLQMAGQYTAVQPVPDRCTRCGACVKVCPVGCITQEDERAVPVFGPGCTGCWACFQHCPDRAIAGWTVGPGQGRYPGPTPELKALFEPDRA